MSNTESVRGLEKQQHDRVSQRSVSQAETNNIGCCPPPSDPSIYVPQVPISLVYRKGLAKKDGSDHMLLHGYGSYEYPYDPRCAFCICVCIGACFVPSV
jgi:hypothetical protein